MTEKFDVLFNLEYTLSLVEANAKFSNNGYVNASQISAVGVMNMGGSNWQFCLKREVKT